MLSSVRLQVMVQAQRVLSAHNLNHKIITKNRQVGQSAHGAPCKGHYEQLYGAQ